MFLVYVGFELKTKKKLKKNEHIYWLLSSDTNFFFKSGVCHLSGDGRGERWVPHSFFISSELLPRKLIWIKMWVESKENYADLRCCFSFICCIAAKSAGYINNTLRNLYTAFCLFVWSLLTPGFISIWNNENKLCKSMHIWRSFSKKNWFQGNKIK